MSDEITLKSECLPDNVKPFENSYFAPWTYITDSLIVKQIVTRKKKRLKSQIMS